MIGPQASLASPRQLPGSEPRVALSPGGLHVVWHAPTPQIRTDADGLAHIAVSEYELLDLPGAPRLPFSSVLVALPPDSNPVLQVISASETEQYLAAPLVLGDKPEGVERDASGQIIGGAFTAATKGNFSVDQAVTLEPIGVVRGVHLARLTFYPVVPQGNTLRITSSLEVDVNFGPELQTNLFTEATQDPVLNLVRAAVVNPEQLQIAAKDQISSTQYRQLQVAGNSTLAVEVSSRGITDISYAGLAADGFIESQPHPGWIRHRLCCCV